MSLYLQSPPPTRPGLGQGEWAIEEGPSVSPYLEFLPVRGLVKGRRDEAAIRAAFDRLDVLKEGRLSLRGLRMVAEQQLEGGREGTGTGGGQAADLQIKKWLRETDRQGRGFVDFQDFKHIFSPLPPSGPNLDPQTGTRTGKASLSNPPTIRFAAETESFEGDPLASQRQRDRDRDRADQRRLRAAFEKYDVDRDGRITLQDMRTALGDQKLTDKQIVAWIGQRDWSGQGAVTFEDFCRHYSGQTDRPNDLNLKSSMSSSVRKNIAEEWTGVLRPADSLHRSQVLTYSEQSEGPGSVTVSSSHKETLHERERDRRQLLREAFSNYDLDGDGFITREDMLLAVGGLQNSGKGIDAWIARRDSSGSGRVSFEDFAKHYN